LWRYRSLRSCLRSPGSHCCPLVVMFVCLLFRFLASECWPSHSACLVCLSLCVPWSQLCLAASYMAALLYASRLFASLLWYVGLSCPFLCLPTSACATRTPSYCLTLSRCIFCFTVCLLPSLACPFVRVTLPCLCLSRFNGVSCASRAVPRPP
jgi:hypothetical protein